MKHLSVSELKNLLTENNDIVLLDVREDWEMEVCQVENSMHIPMGNIPAQIEQLDKDKTIAVMCHHGMRSQQVCSYLESQGFSNLFNVSGGIDAWAKEIDSSLQLY